MAYMSQDLKKKLAPAIKSILKKYNAKGTLSVNHHSTLVVTISQSPFDIDGHASVNNYHYHRQHASDPVMVQFLDELYAAMNNGNHDRSDSMTDYFDVGWYSYIWFGRWNKPHKKIEAGLLENKKL